MVKSIFVFRLDKDLGFIVEKRYPATLTLDEKILSHVYYKHEKEKTSCNM